MRTSACDMFGIEIPLFAFSHCRDVVAAVTNAGGFGVLGAVTHAPEELEHELAWIDREVAGKPYGADVLVPSTFVGKGEQLTPAEVAAYVPAEHRAFVSKLLADHGVDTASAPPEEMTWAARAFTEQGAQETLDVVFRHPVKLVASALGVPPAFMVERARAAGVPVAALVGSARHAVRQVAAGVDLIVAQGTEAGGHCGEVTTMVLVPEVVEAVARASEAAGRSAPVPVLGAGGIVTGRQLAAAIALGADGAWTGTMWLTTDEAETASYTKQKLLAATSRDTVRSTSRTGKPSRQLASAWTAAWDGEGSPGSLPMPLQSMLSEPALRRVDQLADAGQPGAQKLATYWVGQGVGLLDRARPVADVVYEFVEDFLAATDRLNRTLAD